MNNKQDTSGPDRTDVHHMFDRIAHRYDLLNHLLSANRDKAWRDKMISLLPQGDRLEILDLATGTADQLLSVYGSGRVHRGVGIDPAEKMLAIGREKIAARQLSESLTLQTGQAERLSFDSESFDATTISFGIRNVTDVPTALQEMHRVLKPGGRSLILEFSLPSNKIVRAGYLLYFRHILPLIGAIVSGDGEAYRYLNRTVETFPYGEEFCGLMRRAGFREVRENRLTLGIATIYQGDK